MPGLLADVNTTESEAECPIVEEILRSSLEIAELAQISTQVEQETNRLLSEWVQLQLRINPNAQGLRQSPEVVRKWYALTRAIVTAKLARKHHRRQERRLRRQRELLE